MKKQIISCLVMVTVTTISAGALRAQSWDTSMEEAKYAHPNWIECKKRAPLSQAKYIKFAKKVFKAAEKKKRKKILNLCSGNGKGEIKKDAVKMLICNLGRYLVYKDASRFVQTAFESANSSKIYFYLDEIFVEKSSRGGSYEQVLFMNKTFSDLYWDQLDELAKKGNKRAFETMIVLSKDADGEIAEDLSVKLGEYFIDNPECPDSYWDVMKANKKTLALYFDYMDEMAEQKYPGPCKGNRDCEVVKGLFRRLGNLVTR